MVRIVTIEREYGCGGGKIACQLAEQLGWKLWDELLTEEIARLAKCPKAVVAQREERNDPLYYRFFKSVLRGSYEGGLNARKLNVVDCESIVRFTKSVVQEAASTGNCVIVGRGSQDFLRDRQDTLRVFLYAPEAEKVRRLVSRGKNEQEARELIDSVDRERAEFIEKYFKLEWPTRSVYHIMINTAIGDANVVQTIVDFMKTLDANLTDPHIS